MEDALLNKIEVTIAGRKYPIKVTPQEQQIVTDIAKNLNQQISDFQIKYADRDKLDCVIMALLTLAFDKHQNDTTRLKDNLSKKLDQIESLLDTVNT